MIITAVLGSMVLAEKIHLGRYSYKDFSSLKSSFFITLKINLLISYIPCMNYSIIGTVLIIFGLYTVLWGKSKDPKSSNTQEGGNDIELPISDSGKSINLEDSTDGAARILKIPAENTGEA